MITISTSPVLGSPCAVSFDATGRESPKPCAERMFAFTPCATRYRTTPVARAVESSQLEGNRLRSSGPMGRLSVNPSTTMRWFCRLCSVGMILLSVASPVRWRSQPPSGNRIDPLYLQPVLELRDLDLVRTDLGLELLVQRLVGLILGAQRTDLLDLLLVGLLETQPANATANSTTVFFIAISFRPDSGHAKVITWMCRNCGV